MIGGKLPVGLSPLRGEGDVSEVCWSVTLSKKGQLGHESESSLHFWTCSSAWIERRSSKPTVVGSNPIMSVVGFVMCCSQIKQGDRQWEKKKKKTK
jgi:hypothetical protein